MKRPPRDRGVLEGALVKAQAAAARGEEELKRAQAQLDHALQKFDDQPTPTEAQRRAVADAREDAERATRRERKASDELSALRVELAAKVRDEKLAEYIVERDRAVAFVARVPELAGAIVKLDEQLDAAVLTIAREYLVATGAHDRAAELAEDLRMVPDLRQRVLDLTLGAVRLEVTRVVTRARIETDRDDVSTWIAQADLSWQRGSETAREKEDMDATLALLAEGKRRRELAEAAAAAKVEGANEAAAIERQVMTASPSTEEVSA